MPRPALNSRLRNLKQENPMNVNHYIGLDVHKKSVSYCVKLADGQIVEESRLRATHDALRQWAGKRPEPWHGAMEATLFSGWIYDTLKPFAAQLQMGHPALMKAIGASKKKTTSWMRGKSPTWCVATYCRRATWRRRRSASCGGCCATATRSEERRVG